MYLPFQPPLSAVTCVLASSGPHHWYIRIICQLRECQSGLVLKIHVFRVSQWFPGLQRVFECLRFANIFTVTHTQISPGVTLNLYKWNKYFHILSLSHFWLITVWKELHTGLNSIKQIWSNIKERLVTLGKAIVLLLKGKIDRVSWLIKWNWSHTYRHWGY